MSQENNCHGPVVLPIPDIPEELLKPVNSLLNTARLYEGIIVMAFEGKKPLEELLKENADLIQITGNVMASWNKKLPETE